ncbi:MAG: YitT family protein [Desulfitobacterium hafniense]|nr:YitT family protein [Desulfitobacterium hafniense]
MRRWDLLRKIGVLLGITVGAIMSAFSVQAFVVQAGLGAGGVGGIALLLYYTFGLPIGIMTILLNLPLFILGWREVNKRFVLYTVFGLMLYSLALDLLKGINPIPFQDIFLGSLYGGVLGGIGSGIVFRMGGSLGGFDIVAKVIQRKFGWDMGTTMLIMNVVIILISWAILGPKIALYTLVSMFAFSRTVDIVQSGIPAKAVTIISNHYEKLSPRIISELGRGVTFLHGRGGYSSESKEVIICVVSLPELGQLKRVVKEVDPKAFMIVQNASEVVGQGFIALE